MTDHRLPGFGDFDAGEHFCHECHEPWPCEVDRLRAVDRLAREYVAAKASGRSVDIGRTWESLRRALGSA